MFPYISSNSSRLTCWILHCYLNNKHNILLQLHDKTLSHEWYYSKYTTDAKKTIGMQLCLTPKQKNNKRFNTLLVSLDVLHLTELIESYHWTIYPLALAYLHWLFLGYFVSVLLLFKLLKSVRPLLLHLLVSVAFLRALSYTRSTYLLTHRHIHRFCSQYCSTTCWWHSVIYGIGCMAHWQNVSLWPANFPCHALNL